MKSLQRCIWACSTVVVSLCGASVASAQSSLFRFGDLDLRDPHIFANVFLFGCQDLTTQTNDQLQTSIQGDANGDGFLDRSTVVEFLPLNQAAATNLFDSGRASCTAPFATTTCGPINSSAIMGSATLSTTTTCLATVPGSIGQVYVPAVTSSSVPCFASPPGTIMLDLGGIPVPLTGAQIAGRFVGSPATSLDNGLLRGFISEVDATNTILPASIPVIGGQPLSSVLRGGAGNCAAGSDKDVFNGVTGWWFYLNYVAPRTARFVDNFANGFANGFEP